MYSGSGRECGASAQSGICEECQVIVDGQFSCEWFLTMIMTLRDGFQLPTGEA
jgi:hypothetical protein